METIERELITQLHESYAQEWLRHTRDSPNYKFGLHMTLDLTTVNFVLSHFSFH